MEPTLTPDATLHSAWVVSFWTLAAAVLALSFWPGFFLVLHRVASSLVVRYNLGLIILGFCCGSLCSGVVPGGLPGYTILFVLAGFTLRLVLVTACQLDIAARVDLYAVPEADDPFSIHTARSTLQLGAISAVPEADDTFSMHTAQSTFLQLGAPSAVLEADLSFGIHTVRASVVSSSVDTQTGPYTVPEVGSYANVHTGLSSAMPVPYPSCNTPVLVQRIPYISTEMLFRLIVPYLDSYELLFTTKACSAYRSFTPAIFSWWRRQAATHRFIADVTNHVVRTSAGTIVHPELGSIMRVQTLSCLPSSLSRSSVTVATYRDIDSLTCDYCGKRRHLAHECWKRLKDEKRLFKLQSRGAHESNNWGWGAYDLCSDDYIPLVCSDAFGIRPRGVSV